MEIENTTYGKIVKVLVDEKIQEYSYRLIRPLNSGVSKLHPCINVLEKQEVETEKKLHLLLLSYESTLKDILSKLNQGNQQAFHEWEVKNKLDFNEYFHDGIRDLVDILNNYSFEYAANCSNDGYGWCL